MKLKIEFRFTGLNHWSALDHYDYDWGTMVRGFQFRVRPLFLALTWPT